MFTIFQRIDPGEEIDRFAQWKIYRHFRRDLAWGQGPGFAEVQFERVERHQVPIDLYCGDPGELGIAQAVFN